MSSQELKSHINSMLGNSHRLLLPSYWWKKMFGAVVDKLDEKVDTSNLKTIGGESLIGEGNIHIGVSKVSSEEELNTLEVPYGDMASVVTGGAKESSWKDCYSVTEEDLQLSIFEVLKKATPIEGLVANVPSNLTKDDSFSIFLWDETYSSGANIGFGYDDETDKLGLVSIYGKAEGSVTQSFLWKEGDTSINQNELNKLNTFISTNGLRYLCTYKGGNDIITDADVLSELYAKIDPIIHPIIKTPIIADTYIKGDTWEKLAKKGEEGAIFRELYIPSLEEPLTEAQKAYNKETIELYKEGKAIVYVAGPDDQKYISTQLNIESGFPIIFFNVLNVIYMYMLDENGEVVDGGEFIKFEDANNKVTTISSASTDKEYPSAKAVYDAIQQSGGEAGPQGPQGEQGVQGEKGEDGVGITSVVQTTTSSADGGSNVVTVTLSDGKTSTFTVKNGSKGTQGEKGADGAKGDKGDKGDTGATGPQGNSGYTGAASELEVVNNLTQGGEASALSAEQGKVLDTKLTELSAEVGRKQDTISDLANIRSGAEKGATAIQEVKTINGQSIVGSGNIEIQGGGGGGMTTPSGDPMHYLYVTAGAEYNDTGADIERTGVYGDTIVWKNGYWWLNELGDITNDQMRAIFVHWQKIRVSSCYRDSKIRTNLPFVTNISNPTSDARDRLSEMCNKGQFETFDMRVTGNNYESSPNWSNLFIYCYYLKKLLGEIDAPAGEISLNCFFWIEEMRLKGLKTNWSMAGSKNFSNASILFAINNEAATSAIVITLRANVYARAMADTEILAALEAHPNVSLASA